MTNPSFLLLAGILLACALSSGAARDPDAELRRAVTDYAAAAAGFGIPGVPAWGAGNGFPGFPGGGWGAGYGSPSGGYSRGGTVRPSVVCREKGPCYKKKLTCPAKCFTSYSHSGKHGGGGGGGGGCSFDCGKRCVAYC